ncbi:hypothetical protein [Thermus caldilimi]|uniref:hypothetical protein n=1 Tax=Thermus caldilimi TaxID=2483360 RepID=UPI0010761A16|nr:hypothetical protein [Thermus caldilimi]
MLREREAKELGHLLSWAGLLGAELSYEGGLLRGRGAERVLSEIEGKYRLPVVELLMLAGGRLEASVLQVLGTAAQGRGWRGMVEVAQAVGILRKYGSIGASKAIEEVTNAPVA